MATLAVPTASIANRRPLSNHGMPKPPRIASPDRTHRFEGLGFSRDSFQTEYASPITPGPLSPPMSARSFGTVIDSEPSTPAYSPRMDYDWDGSSLVLLRPMTSSSEPASPSEPAWDMLSPVQITQRNNMRSIVKSRVAEVRASSKPAEIKLGPVPVKRIKMSSPKVPSQQEVRVIEPAKVIESPQVGYVLPQPERREVRSPKPAASPIFEEKIPPTQAKEVLPGEQKTTESAAAPLNKLASKMKSMLRRRSATDSHKEKKKKRTDYYEVQDVHWTEM